MALAIAGCSKATSAGAASHSLPSFCVADGGAYGTNPPTDGGPNDPRRPPDWSDLETPEGYPVDCTVNGLICFYPIGQAECSPDGQTLVWWVPGNLAACAEYPPVLDAGCCAPGLTCSYVSGPPGPNAAGFATTSCKTSYLSIISASVRACSAIDSVAAEASSTSAEFC